MRFSCEVIVYEVLPVARRNLARELVQKHNMNQNQVARLFNVTGAAVCQYMKGKRGTNDLIEGGPYAESFRMQIEAAAEKLAKGESDITTELCKICGFAKGSGLLSVYAEVDGGEPYHRCHECPKKEFDPFQ
jgi:predicted transcriptional regulator